MTIEVRALSKRYGNTFAIKGVSFKVEPGKVTGFLGPNGAGKSTTMRCIVGLDRPTSGEALVYGQRYNQLSTPLLKVGALLDAKAAHRARTARNYLTSIAATHRIPKGRVDQVLDISGLTPAATRKVGAFSLGMGQRLGIAAALLGDPQTLILDEPVNGLDPAGITWVRGLLRSLADEGRTVFLSSHLLSELALVADHVIIIGRGTLIADASLATLTADTQKRIRVRSPQAKQLARLAAADGVTSKSTTNEIFEFLGATTEYLADTAFAAGIRLYELTPVQQTLEEAYTAITRNAAEYTSAD